MGILLTKMMTVFGDKEHKVVLVGLDNAGKTTILYQFLTKEAVHTSPTIGSNVEEITVRNTHFLVWDIGGQESLRAAWYSYFCHTEIVIVVVDSTDRERLTVTKDELHRMLAHESGSVLGCSLDSVRQVGDRRVLDKLTSMLDHDCHPLQDTLTALESNFSDRLIHPRCVKDRFRRSFLPAAVRLYNENC